LTERRDHSKPKPEKLGDVAEKRGLPANVDAERFVLGSILLDETNFAKASESIAAEDFSLHKHRIIWSRMKDIRERGHQIDRVSLADELSKQRQLESVDGLSYLVSLDEGLPSLSNLPGYIRLVREKSIERRSIFLAAKLGKSLLTGADAREVLASASSEIFELQERLDSANKTIFSPEEAIAEAGSEAVFRPWDAAPGLPTGWLKLDEELSGGLISPGLVCLAAETSNGKTAFAGNMALNLVKNNHGTLYFTGEMSKIDMLHRLAAAHCELSFTRFRRGWLSEETQRAFRRSIVEVSQFPIYLDETNPLTIHDMMVRTTRMVQEKKISCVVVDYVQILNLQRSGDGINFRDEREALTYISSAWVGLSKALKIPIVFLSQFSRAKRGRDKSDRRPKLSDLFGASALENNSSCVIAIYRPEFDRPGDETIKNTAEVIILKNRNGPRSVVHMQFLPSCMVFKEREDESFVPPPDPQGTLIS
jgi:replicative DNA helicase